MPTQKKTTIGGQAIIEGIVMKGPRRVCTVVRKANGELVVKEEDAHQPSAFWKLPVLRGAYGLFMAMKDGIQAINYSASFFEDEEVGTTIYNPDQIIDLLELPPNSRSGWRIASAPRG